MIGRDLLLNNDHDLAIEGFDLKLTNDSQIVAQRVKQELLTIKGEWFLNEELGVPYLELLGQKNSTQSINSTLISHIMRIKGVKEIIFLKVEEDKASRQMVIKIEIRDIFDNELYLTL